MAYVLVTSQPVCEPVTLAQVKDYCAIPQSITDFDNMLPGLAIAARELCEEYTTRKFINTGLVQTHDFFPYWVDSMFSTIAYPPSAYLALPRYSTTTWNYSQLIKLIYSKLYVVDEIKYVASDGSGWKSLIGSDDPANTTADFIVDPITEPGRIFPRPGTYWPSCLYVQNSVEIYHTVGYNNDAAIQEALAAMTPPIEPATSTADCTPQEAGLRQADVPQRIKTAILALTAHLFDNREPVSDLTKVELPWHVQALLNSELVIDFGPTRG